MMCVSGNIGVSNVLNYDCIPNPTAGGAIGGFTAAGGSSMTSIGTPIIPPPTAITNPVGPIPAGPIIPPTQSGIPPQTGAIAPIGGAGMGVGGGVGGIVGHGAFYGGHFRLLFSDDRSRLYC